jgi:DNA repair photolyase
MSRFVWLLALAGLLAAGGCEQVPADPMPGNVTSEDVRRDAGQAVDTAATYSQQAKEEFRKKLAARLTELDAEIAKLREKGRDLQDEAKADWDRKLADLEAKREAAGTKLTEVGAASAEAWKDVQQGAQSAWDELDKAFREAAGEF